MDEFTRQALATDVARSCDADGCAHRVVSRSTPSRANTAWFELALLAHDIVVWTQQPALDGEHRLAEPKRLRYRILHVAGALTRHARAIRRPR